MSGLSADVPNGPLGSASFFVPVSSVPLVTPQAVDESRTLLNQEFQKTLSVALLSAIRRSVPEWLDCRSIEHRGERIVIGAECAFAPQRSVLRNTWAYLSRELGAPLTLELTIPDGKVSYSGKDPQAARPIQFHNHSAGQKAFDKAAFRDVVEQTLPRGLQLWSSRIYQFPHARGSASIGMLRVLQTNGHNPSITEWRAQLEKRFGLYLHVKVDKISAGIERILATRADADGLLRDGSTLTEQIRRLHGERAPSAVHTKIAPYCMSDRNLQDMRFITIDPAGSTELDDAHYAELLPSGSVHMWSAYADVSHLVEPNSRVFNYAQRACFSLYGRWASAPLLGAVGAQASLQPGLERTAWVSEYIISPTGIIEYSDFYRARLKNHHMLAYSAIEQGSPEAQQIYGILQYGAACLKRRRSQSVTPVSFGSGGPAEQVIAECAVMAKEICANFCHNNKIPVLYRVQVGSTGKQRNLSLHSVRALGIHARRGDFSTPARFVKLMKSVRDQGYEDLANTIVDLSLGSARYDLRNYGHHGLGLPAYVSMSGLRDFAASINHIQLDRFFRDEETLPLSQLKPLQRNVNRKRSVLVENTRKLLIYERVREGLELRGEDREGYIISAQPEAVKVRIPMDRLGSLSELFSHDQLTNSGYPSDLSEGASLRVRLEGYSPALSRFVFSLLPR